MENKRRQFLTTCLKAGAVIPFLSLPLSSCENLFNKKLNILILGGTSFLGPHQVAYALGRGHNISIFTRGKTKPTVHSELFKNVEQLVGDRVDNLEALKNRKWDAVIDNSGRNEQWTHDTAELLKDNVELYLYTSSTGVYFPYLGNDISENTEVLLDVPEEITDENEKMEYGYGVMKAKSELEAKNIFGEDRTIIVRPTYMVGPGDQLDRFIHWPVRLSKGGEVLVPGKSDDPVQFIDVRDVAEWMIRLIEDKNTNTFNAVGPQNEMDVQEFMKQADNAFDIEHTFIKIDDYDFLKSQGVYYIVPWIMPEGKNKGTALINNEKAKNNGLTFTPLDKIMKDTHKWWYSNALTKERRQKFEGNSKGILAREKNIIEAWKGLQS